MSHRLDEKRVVKITNSRLAPDLRELNKGEVEDSRTSMVIKWMAPECIETSKFDSHSDVVSIIMIL